MDNILDKVNTPADLKHLNLLEKQVLAEDIRKLILDVTSKTGGHLASGLGAVELTIALHSVFNTPKDKLVWDVGHQTYAHKILTGRKDKMHTLRQLDGISGFPKTSESEYDVFDVGHSGTSISVALGMARARDLLSVGPASVPTAPKADYEVIAIIGDGALTSGMALEALNDAGCSKANIIVILNDNEMSISKNVGGIPMLLSEIRSKRLYTRSNNAIKRFTNRIPVIGKPLVALAHNTKKAIKQIFIHEMYFEEIGFTYLGPVDGHDIEKLENILKLSKNIEGPVLVHVITKKGKGYKIAEENPNKFHGVSSFDIATGAPIIGGVEAAISRQKDYSAVFGNKLVELAKKDKKIVAITAAMKDGTGLAEFAKEFPDRFFDVGIAEQHAVGLIAGMAKSGLKPVFAVYSSFLQRGYDQLIHDIAIQDIPVTICLDRAGIVGADGETHQGLFDLSYLSSIPNINIMAPKNFEELEQMLDFAVNLNEPVVIRYPRGGEDDVDWEKDISKIPPASQATLRGLPPLAHPSKLDFVSFAGDPGARGASDSEEIQLGKAETIKQGKDLTIIAIGKMVSRAKEVSDILAEKGIDAEIINARFLKPLNKETIINSTEKTKRIVTIEDNTLIGGLGDAVIRLINNVGVAWYATRAA